MQTSANGRKFIENWEESGKPLLTARWDPLGHCWEIGFGHTSAAGLPRVHQGMTITPAQADQILGSDLASVEADLTHHVKGTLTQNQFDAIVSFDFNTGGLDRSSVLRDINSGHYDKVAADLLLWDHAGGQFVQGLFNRRKAEGVLFNTPVAPAVVAAVGPTP